MKIKTNGCGKDTGGLSVFIVEKSDGTRVRIPTGLNVTVDGESKPIELTLERGESERIMQSLSKVGVK